jgi:hypothetical protein
LHTCAGGLLRANAIRSPVARFVRRLVLSVLTRIPAVCQRFISTAAEDTVSYTRSSLAAAGSAAAAKCAGTAFPDVALSIGGVMRPATDLLRGGVSGSFGTLVLLTPPGSNSSSGVDQAGWPSRWGRWPLHVVSVARQGAASDGGGGVDEWGRLSASVGGADGVLVRPDGIIAAAGGVGVVRGWFAAHGMVCS